MKNNEITTSFFEAIAELPCNPRSYAEGFLDILNNLVEDGGLTENEATEKETCLIGYLDDYIRFVLAPKPDDKQIEDLYKKTLKIIDGAISARGIEQADDIGFLEKHIKVVCQAAKAQQEKIVCIEKFVNASHSREPYLSIGCSLPLPEKITDVGYVASELTTNVLDCLSRYKEKMYGEAKPVTSRINEWAKLKAVDTLQELGFNPTDFYIKPAGLTGKDIDIVLRVNSVEGLEGKRILTTSLISDGKPIDIFVTDGKSVLVSKQVSPQEAIFTAKPTGKRLTISQETLGKLQPLGKALSKTESVAEAIRSKVLYHGGPENITFDFDKLVFSTKADSSQLGYFFSPTELPATHYAGKTGKVRPYILDAKKVYVMPQTEYVRYGSRKAFREVRLRLIKEGYDVVFIPHMEEYVALVPDVIKSALHSQAEAMAGELWQMTKEEFIDSKLIAMGLRKEGGKWYEVNPVTGALRPTRDELIVFIKRDLAKEYLHYLDSLKPTTQVTIPAGTPRPARVLTDKYLKVEGHPVAAVTKDLAAFKKANPVLDVTDVESSLNAYKALKRADFDDADEFADAKEEVWSEIIDALDGLAEAETESLAAKLSPRKAMAAPEGAHPQAEAGIPVILEVTTVNEIKATHVTNNPQPVIDALKSGKNIGETRSEGLVGDLGVSGLYFSQNPQMWVGRATGKYSFLNEITPEQRDKLVNKIVGDIESERKTGHIAEFEYETAMRDIGYIRSGQYGNESLVNFANQPYSIAFWKESYLKDLGIKQTKPPMEIPVVIRGKFADITNFKNNRDELIASLKGQGYDGVIDRGSWGRLEQGVVWNSKAVKQFGEYKPIALPQAKAMAEAGLPKTTDVILQQGTLYHNTSLKNAQSILKTGFRVEDTSKLSEAERGFVSGNLGDGVYLSPNYSENMNFWGGESNLEVKPVRPLHLYNLGDKEGAAQVSLKFIDELKQKNYDGIIVNDPNPHSGGFQVVVFDPSLVKPRNIVEYNFTIRPEQLSKVDILLRALPQAEVVAKELWKMTREEAAIQEGWEIGKDYLYHTTPAKNLEAIRQEGLISKTRTRNDYGNRRGEFLEEAPLEELLYFEKKPTGTWGGIGAIRLRIDRDAIPRNVWVDEDVLRPGEIFASSRKAFEISPEAMEYWDRKTMGWKPFFPDEHEIAVRQALSEGKPVPAEVLKDYPELAKALPKAEVVPVTPEVAAVAPTLTKFQKHLDEIDALRNQGRRADAVAKRDEVRLSLMDAYKTLEETQSEAFLAKIDAANDALGRMDTKLARKYLEEARTLFRKLGIAFPTTEAVPVAPEVKFSRPFAGSKGGLAIMEYKATIPVVDDVVREQIINAYKKVKNAIGYTTYSAIYKETGLPYKTILGILKQEHINDPSQIHFNVDKMGKNVFFKYDKKPALPQAEAGMPERYLMGLKPQEMVNFIAQSATPKNTQELYDFLIDYARIADPDIQVSDKEVAQIAGSLAKRVRLEISRLKQGRSSIKADSPEAILDDLRRALGYLEYEGRLNHILGIDSLVHLAHRIEQTVLPALFDVPYQEQYKNIGKILDYLAGEVKAAEAVAEVALPNPDLAKLAMPEIAGRIKITRKT